MVPYEEMSIKQIIEDRSQKGELMLEEQSRREKNKMKKESQKNGGSDSMNESVDTKHKQEIN